MAEAVKRIILSGGGTGGSVTPLLALAEDLEREEPGVYRFLFVGTYRGPEKFLAESAGIKFKAIASGKWRRYFSLKNIFDIFNIAVGFFQSMITVLFFRPRLIMSAGGFVSVPLVWAGWMRRVPVLIHQQDIRPGLANLMMAPFAKKITVTFAKSIDDYGPKAVWTGNPVKDYLKIYADSLFNEVKSKYKITGDRPLVLIIGGGTGSEFINRLVAESVPQLINFYHVIQVAGQREDEKKIPPNDFYQKFSFLPHAELLELMKLSALVVSRCGLGALTEIAALSRPALLIPMPDSHQEDNARIFSAAEAAFVMEEKDLNADIFVSNLRALLSDPARLEQIGKRGHEIVKIGNENLARVVRSLLV